MRDDLMNHIIKEKKVVIIHGLIFVQIYVRKMHFLHFWPLGLLKQVKFFLENKFMYCIQESKMLINWTAKLFIKNDKLNIFTAVFLLFKKKIFLTILCKPEGQKWRKCIFLTYIWIKINPRIITTFFLW